jgi:cytochrome c oxidase subunit 2
LSVVLVAGSAFAWMHDTAEDEAPPSSSLELVERGRLLFGAKGCIACHHIATRGIVDGYGMGPDLSSLPEQAGTRAEGLSAEEYVRVSILNPNADYAPGFSVTFGMPQLEVSGDELDALVAFLLDDG